MLASRRGFLGGLAALVAAPAVVKVSSIMPVRSIITGPDALTLAEYSPNQLLTINMITREALRLFEKKNLFIQDITERQELRMAPNGDMLRVRLPSDYVAHPVDVAYGKMQLRPEWVECFSDLNKTSAPPPVLSAPAAVALGAAAVLAANPTVSRRFFQGSARSAASPSADQSSSPTLQRTTGDR